MNLGNWQLDTVNGGLFRLDGGVMFGVVPKEIWRYVTAADQHNRILCANHCVLARDGRHTVLIDCGYGGKHDRLDRKFYCMEPGNPLLESLARLGVEPASIDTVVFSHLHFDHVCGASHRLADSRDLALTFPNARHVVGRVEWEDATNQASELETAYPMEDILALRQAKELILIDDGDEIVPGLSAQITGGHTRGHLSFSFRSQGQTAFYPGDICPSTFHMRQMWHLAYDLYPVDTRRNKPRLLGQAADEQWWMLWNHDPTTAVSRVVRDAKKEFVSVDARQAL